MPRNRTLPGRLTQFERPNWDPLIELVGLDLVGSFMWMNELALGDGTTVHAYKHVATRRYLHVGEDGRTFRYEGTSRYRELEPSDALEAVFWDWEETWPSPSPAARAAVEELLRRIAT